MIFGGRARKAVEIRPTSEGAGGRFTTIRCLSTHMERLLGGAGQCTIAPTALGSSSHFSFTCSEFSHDPGMSLQPNRGTRIALLPQQSKINEGHDGYVIHHSR